MFMNFGFVYIATNESFKNLQKIGFTSRNPSERISELDSTGVPTPFKISYLVCLNNPYKFEQIIHEKLNQYRKRDNREFFEINLIDAINTLKDLISEHNIEIKFEEFDQDISLNKNITKNNRHEDIDNYYYSEDKDELRINGIDDEWLRRDNLKKLVNSNQVDTAMLDVLTRFDPKEIAEFYFYFIRYCDSGVWIFSDSYGFNEDDEDDKKNAQSKKINFLSLYQTYELKTKISGVDLIEKEFKKWLPLIFNYFENKKRTYSSYMMDFRSLFDIFDFLMLPKLQVEVFSKFSAIAQKTNFIYQYNYARMLFILGNTEGAIKNLEWFMLLSLKEVDLDNLEHSLSMCNLFVAIKSEQGTIQNKETENFLVNFCKHLINYLEDNKSSINKTRLDYYQNRIIPILNKFITGNYGDIKTYKDAGKYLKVPLTPFPSAWYKK